MKAQAIFKAYELDPEDPFVQENLLMHYLSSRKTYSRAFKLMVRSMQQSSLKLEPTHPLVTSILAYLNSRDYFSSQISLSGQTTTRAVSDKRNQLLEAISLIKLIARDDLMSMFQELLVFLSHQKGDYLSTVKYLEKLVQANDGGELIQLMLFEAYLGVKVQGYDNIKQMIDQAGLNATEQAQKVLNIESISDEDVKAETERLIREFCENPRQVGSRLCLYQEVCLERGILPSENVLDIDDDIQHQIQQLSIKEQKMILVQSLRFCQRRDGELFQNTKIMDKG